MPLVFVHGVNVRRGNSPGEHKNFDDSVNARDQLFRTIGLAGLVPTGQRLYIENPYWGDHGARFAYDLASVPVPSTETFGTADNALAQVLLETVPIDVAKKTKETDGSETMLLLTLARTHSLGLAVDAVVAAAVVSGPGDGLDAEGLGTFAAMAVAYAALNPNPDWLDNLQSDSKFLEDLVEHVTTANVGVPDGEIFGIGPILEWMKGAAQGLANAADSTFNAMIGATIGAMGGALLGGVPGPALRALRPLATQRAGIFLGDTFVYLDKRGSREQPGEIVKIVAGAIKQAEKHKLDEDNRLVVVAHSMGGNIVYDILTHYQPDLKVDLLVTVGSQVAVFKELGLYKEDDDRSGAPLPTALVNKPINVGAWLNVFDPLDVLGFAVEGVFTDTKDFAFSNQASVLDAHSLYFFRPTFHQRLRARMAEIGIGTAK